MSFGSYMLDDGLPGLHPGWAMLAQRAVELPDLVADDDDGGAQVVPPLFELSAVPPGRRMGRPRRAMQELQRCISGSVSGERAGVEQPLRVTGQIRERERADEHRPRVAMPMAEIVESYFLPVVPAWLAPRCTLTAPLMAALARARLPHALLDAKMLALANRFLGVGKAYHLTAAVVVEQDTEISRKRLTLKLHRLACAIWLFLRHARETLECQLAASVPQSRHLLYLETSSYDETPMIARVKPGSTAALSHTGTRDAAMQPPHLACLAAAKQNISLADLPTTAKLLQVRSGFAVALEVLGQVMVFMGESFNPLCVMQQNNAKVLKTCLDSLAAVSSSSCTFKLKIRNVTVDSAGANSAAELDMQAARGGEWQLLKLACNTHLISTCHRRSLDVLLAGEVSGLIRTSLSIREGCKMALWRACLSEEVRQRLVIRVGSPPPGAAERRASLMSIHLDQDKDALMRALLLEGACNGDWSNTAEVEHWIPSSQRMPEKTEVLRLVCSSLLTGLAGTQPAVYPRHRWTGAPRAISDIALLACVHSLLWPVWKRFLEAIAHGGAAAVPDIAMQEEEEDGALIVPLDGEVGQHDVPEQVPLQPGSLLPLAEDGASSSNSSGHAAFNAKCRAAANAWLSQAPGLLMGKLLLMRMVVAPLAHMLHSQLDISGQSWEDRQRSKVARSMMSGERPSCHRQYRITVAADGVLEGRCMREIEVLFQDEKKWALCPTPCRTLRFRSLSFRTLAKAASAVFQLCAVPHREFPYRAFQVISAPDKADEVSNVPQCLKDEHTLMIERTFPAYQGDACRAVMLTLAHTASTDISQVECRHASVRRGLTMGSVQTWRMGTSMVSAHWVFQNCRRRSGSVVKKSIPKVWSGPWVWGVEFRASV